jgi:hypothetical protein
MSLIAIGTLAYDTIETVHEKREDVLGGSGVHFGAAAANFVAVRMVGVVGQDFEEAHLATMKDGGIDCEGVEVAAGKTFRWGGRYEADWNKTLLDAVAEQGLPAPRVLILAGEAPGTTPALELALGTTAPGARVLIGHDDQPAKLARLARLLEAGLPELAEVEEIDLRFGDDVVLRPRAEATQEETVGMRRSAALEGKSS